MRHLVQCPQCRRQYDATGRAVESRFRCRCGEVVTVKQPKGHDAAVVRCSSCGAPRTEESRNCKFCNADFTIHERDLNTVCPKCMARVSDRARFCHHCGIGLVAELVAGDETPLVCPACGEEQRLGSRRIGEVTVLECDVCAGFWLGNHAFEQLTERAANDALSMDTYFKLKPERPTPPELPGRWRYRRCVRCDSMMHRRHYGKKSGVIVDVCKIHGVWFDANELPNILAYLRSGGKAKADMEHAAEAARAEKLDRLSGVSSGSVALPPSRTAYPAEGSFLDLVGEFFRVLFT